MKGHMGHFLGGDRTVPYCDGGYIAECIYQHTQNGMLQRVNCNVNYISIYMT